MISLNVLAVHNTALHVQINILVINAYPDMYYMKENVFKVNAPVNMSMLMAYAKNADLTVNLAQHWIKITVMNVLA